MAEPRDWNTPAPEERDVAPVRRGDGYEERLLQRRKAAQRAAALRRSKRRWRGFLAVYAVLFLILGAAGCYLLYR